MRAGTALTYIYPTSPLGDRWFRGCFWPLSHISSIPVNPYILREGFTPPFILHWIIPPLRDVCENRMIFMDVRGRRV